MGAIHYGIARMADGKRKQSLLDLATLMFDEGFAGRIFPFDADAAVHFAGLAAEGEARVRLWIWPMARLLPSLLYMMREWLPAMFGTSTT